MGTWHAVRIRGDLYRIVVDRARQERRSVASQIDVLLSWALDREPRTDGVQTSDGSSTLSASDRAPDTRDLLRQFPPGDLAGQITVDEALKHCPVCNDSLDDERRCVDPECVSHRVAS